MRIIVGNAMVTKQPQLGELREQVIVATTVEKPDGDVSTMTLRPGVIRVFARIRPLRPSQIYAWLAVFDQFARGGVQPTHEITIRWPPDIKIDLNHWCYANDKHTGIRTWYRINSTEDLGGVHRFLVLYCSIDAIDDPRSDPATQLRAPVWRSPHEDEEIIDRI